MSFRCTLCFAYFASKSDLKCHLEKSHLTQKLFERAAVDGIPKGKLRSNRKSKSGDANKSYACCVCEVVFANKGNLIRHLKTHTGWKPFHCNSCDATFGEKHSLYI